jgi:hypothetical protein
MSTGSLLHKKPIRKRRVLTEERLNEIKVGLEHIPQKSPDAFHKRPEARNRSSGRISSGEFSHFKWTGTAFSDLL